MNVAETWPEMAGVDLTPPAAIEQAARFVADQPTQERRHRALFELKAKHSAHAGRLIETRARRIYGSKKYGR